MTPTPSTKTFDQISIGETASFERIITTQDVAGFAELSGDHNPLHTDPAYATETQFGRPVVHGFFLASLASRLIGMELPGKYCLLLKESFEFKKPTFVGNTVTVSGTVTHKSDAGQLLEIAVEIRTTEILASGTVTVKVLQ